MSKIILSVICLSLSISVQATSSIYKCFKDDKIVFSQHSCPADFRQHEIEYEFGITTETDSDKPISTQDPLQALFQKGVISKERLLQLVDGEVYRLNQENSYYEILRVSELQKLERSRYWQKKEVDHPEFTLAKQKMNEHFDNLIKSNTSMIEQLLKRKHQITQPINFTD
ncbi:DUF4124 domain-containing protein [Shewanella youngdeokensis]|uniref:DUF4124 domain-containing protein n=1 Tax=Shewanella youngdeokensis TaxID=2999068 RepID=A0ABZ0JZB7_9GAMM|nr:DUF4124 domain-containing protein [Shewanella sp. DAU334]